MRKVDQMVTHSYRTGTWTGLQAASGVALLSPQFEVDTVRALWQAMCADIPVHQWLETLTAGGLSGLPDFALARVEGERVRILLRGQVEALADGTVIRAEEMSTWREHVGQAPQHLRLSAPEDGEERWPLHLGVVRAAAIEFEGTAQGTSAAEVPAHAAQDAGAGDTPNDDARPGGSSGGPEGHRGEAGSDEPAPAEASDFTAADRAEEQNVAGPSAQESDSGAAGNDPSAAVQDTGVPEAQENDTAGVAGAEADAPEAQEDDAAGVVGAEADVPAAGESDAANVGTETDSVGNAQPSGAIIDSLPWDVPALKDDEAREPEAGSSSPEQGGSGPVESAAGAGTPETDDADSEQVADASELTVIPDSVAGTEEIPAATEAPPADETLAAIDVVDAGTDQQGESGPGIGHDGSEAAGDPHAHPPVDDGDHDGHTVLVGHLHAALEREGAAQGAEAGHAGSEESSPHQAPVATLAVSTGQEVLLDRTALLGRAPESQRIEGPITPHLVAVPSPQQDISRTHVEITPEGDHVVITDLHSTNGTVVTLPGSEPRRLHPGESTPVGHGAVVDLGDGVTVQVRMDLPDADDASGGSAQVAVQPDAEGQPGAEGQHHAEAQPGAEGQYHAEGQPSAESQHQEDASAPGAHAAYGYSPGPSNGYGHHPGQAAPPPYGYYDAAPHPGPQGYGTGQGGGN